MSLLVFKLYHLFVFVSIYMLYYYVLLTIELKGKQPYNQRMSSPDMEIKLKNSNLNSKSQPSFPANSSIHIANSQIPFMVTLLSI